MGDYPTQAELDRITEKHASLREPFPADRIGKLPKAGITLDYVGHGAVTERLLQVDPAWNWEPLAFDERGLPAFTVDGDGNPIALWIKLTVAGVTRLGCGTCGSKQFDAEKVLIGDALRNAAMRFGVALDLWIKGHAEDDERRSETGAPSRGRSAPKEAWEGQRAEYKRLSDAVQAIPDETQRVSIVEWVVSSKIGPDTFTKEQRDEIEAMIAKQPVTVGAEAETAEGVQSTADQQAWPAGEEPF